MWASFDLKLEQRAIESASFKPKVCMLKSEVMEMLLYGSVTWTLGVENSTALHSAHRKLLLQITSFHRPQRADHRIRIPTTSTRHNARALRRRPANGLSIFAGAVQHAKPWVTHPASEDRDDSWWGEPGTGSVRNNMVPMPGRPHRGC